MDALLSPSLAAVRAAPSLAWVPLLILWIGIGETPRVILIAIGAFFPVLATLVVTIGISLYDKRAITVVTSSTRSDRLVFWVTFVSGLHYLMIDAMAASYMVIPLGGFPNMGDAAQSLVKIFAGVFALGIQMAAPFILLSVIFNLGVGLANRMLARRYPDHLDDVFTYDDASRLLTAESQRYSNVTTRSYFDDSTLEGETLQIDGETYAIGHTYDAANRCSQKNQDDCYQNDPFERTRKTAFGVERSEADIAADDRTNQRQQHTADDAADTTAGKH